MSEVVEPKIASMGKPQRVDLNVQAMRQEEQKKEQVVTKTPEELEAEKTNTAAASTQKTQAEIDAELAATAAAENKNTETKTALTDEELKAEYEKRFPPKAEETADEKKKAESAFEKRMLDFYVEGGGNIEQFSLMKQIGSLDLTELSKVELSRELKAKGFNEEEIKIIQQERLEQLSDEELERFDDETSKEFAKRKKEYDREQVESKGKQTKQQAADFFKILAEAVNGKDLADKADAEHQTLLATKETQFASNVEDHFKKVERKLALQLGKVNDTEIAPVDYEVPEYVIAEVKEVLKDPAKRKQLLYNNDGDLNLESLSEIILKAKMFDSAMKTTYLEAGSRQVAILEKAFPMRSAYGVGLNNGNTKPNDKATVVSAGKMQRVQRQPVNQ